LTLDYSRVGPKFKQKLASVEKEVKGREREIADEILEAGRSKVTVGGEGFELTPEDLVMSFLPPEGRILEEEHGTVVVLDTTRDEALIAEGLVRDVARRVQMTRKMAGLNPTEMLSIVHVGGLDAESKGLIAGHLKTLAYLVRSRSVKVMDKIPRELFKASHSLDDMEVTVGFKKAPRKRQAAKKGKKAKPTRRRKSSRTTKRG
jgi:isoleucyl-tRNA synthetase